MVPLSILPNLLRAQDVKRWMIVRTDRPQNLAEHSFNVAIIAGAIACRMGKEPAHIMARALLHDADEVWTGDIPSVTKQALKDKGFDWKTMEEKKDQFYKECAHIIKAADFLDAVNYMAEHGKGRHAGDVRHDIEIQFGEFMAKFQPGAFRDAVRDVRNAMSPDKYDLRSPYWG